MKEYTRIKQSRTNWGRRMNKWVARENGGNHCWIELKKKRLKRIKYSLIEFWDKNNPTNNQITGALEEEDKKKEIDKMFTEIIVKNFPNMGKEIAT